MRRGLGFVICVCCFYMVSSCTKTPRRAYYPNDYGQFSRELTKHATMSPDLNIFEIGRVHYFIKGLPVWHISSRKAPDNAPKLLIIGGLGRDEQLASEAIAARIGLLAQKYDAWEGINVDFLPLLNPWNWLDGAGPALRLANISSGRTNGRNFELDILKTFLAGKDYDMVLIYREAADTVGFSITQYGSSRDFGDFTISILRDRGHMIRTYLPQKLLAQNIKLDNGILRVPESLADNKKHIIRYLRKASPENIFALNVPKDESRAGRLEIFHKATDIFVRLLSNNFNQIFPE